MKKGVLITALALASALVINNGNAQMMGGGHGMMGEYGMGPGMMHGYGYGPCMFGGCFDHDPVPGQPGGVASEKYQKFLDETKDLRKKLHDLRFEYGEMARNPTTTIEDRNKMEKEILDLQQKIREKAVK